MLLNALFIFYLLIFVAANSLKVRLSGSPHPNEGRVEVYFNSTWGTICDSSWDIYGANVVCRMLGYSYALLARPSSYYGEGSGPIWLDRVGCTGGERTIGECYHSGWGVHSSTCNHSSDFGVFCLSESLYVRYNLPNANVTTISFIYTKQNNNIKKMKLKVGMAHATNDKHIWKK